MLRNRHVRRVLRLGAMGGTAVSLVMAVTSATQLSVSAAATNAGAARVVTPVDTQPSLAPLSSGGSSTKFTLALPNGAACSGDSTTGQYRVQSFMVPSTVDPSTLTFNANGPIVASGFHAPLYDTTSNPYVNRTTQNASPPAVTGPINQAPAFSYAVYAPGNVPPGTYNIGIACTQGPAGPTQLDKFWVVQKTFAQDAADSPAQLAWTVQQPPTTTTTVAPSTTTSTSTANTTATTFAPPTTTPLSVGARIPPGNPSAVGHGGSNLVAGTGGTHAGTLHGTSAGHLAVNSLPKTGRPFVPMVIWSLLLLAFGRAAVLLGRRPRVIEVD